MASSINGYVVPKRAAKAYLRSFSEIGPILEIVDTFIVTSEKYQGLQLSNIWIDENDGI